MKARYTSKTKSSFLLWKNTFSFTPYPAESVACLNLQEKNKTKQNKNKTKKREN